MAPSVVWLQEITPKVCGKTHEDLFLEITPKKDLHDLCGRKFVGKIAQKTFRASLGKFGKKCFVPQKFSCSCTYDERAPPPPLPPFERAEGEMLLPCLHSPASVCILFYTLFTRCCRLQCVTEMNTNYHWSPKTELFTPTKISGNAQKQGVEDTQWCVRTVHNCKIQGCANVSSNSNQSEGMQAGDDGHPGLTVWSLLNYARIENTHKLRKKTFVFIMWLLYVQLLVGQNRYGLVWAVMINPPELPIIDEARNDTHIQTTRVRLY